MSTSPTLYAIGEDLLALDALLFEVGGDISEEEAAAAIEQWFAENEAALVKKLDGYGYLVRRQEADGKFLDEEIRRLTARKQARENGAKRLKDRLKDFLQQHGMKDVETDHFRFAIQKNGGKRPVEVTVQPEALPKKFQRVKIEADNEAIRQELERLNPDPDAETVTHLKFAMLHPRGTHLRIR